MSNGIYFHLSISYLRAIPVNSQCRYRYENMCCAFHKYFEENRVRDNFKAMALHAEIIICDTRVGSAAL